MGSLTVRNIGDDVKHRLRLRAARHGRSMEDEIRHILADAGTGDLAGTAGDSGPGQRATRRAASVPSHVVPQTTTLVGRRILLVIGGGIAAYKSLDLARRLKERGAE